MFKLSVAAIPVNADPSIAGKAPDSLLELTVDSLASATVPVRFPAGIFVKLEPLPDTFVKEPVVADTVVAEIVPVTVAPDPDVDKRVVPLCLKSTAPPEAAFIHPMKVEYENKKVIGDLNVVKAIMYRRDPSKDGQFHLIGKNGTAYRWDCIITERSTDTDDAASIGKHIAAAFTEFGKDRTDDGTVDPSPQKQNEFKWKQPPVFVFQKDVSSDPPKPMQILGGQEVTA